MNANTGDVAWKVPLGVYPELAAKGIPPTGTPNLGGPIATASGVVFIGATKDARFRAFDARTGKELWHAQLEAAGAATPMTFMARNGTQYVVIAAGGPGDTDRGGTEQYSQKLVAFALSDRVATSASSAGASTKGASASEQALPAMSMAAQEEGRRLTEIACTTCHGMAAQITAARTPEAWKKVVDDMITLGAQASVDEARIITEYLSRTYPARKND